VTAIVLRADARALPLPDASVDLIVTSPPYFGLRSYSDTVKCLKCIDLERDGRDPRQAWPDYDAHVKRDHTQHYDGQIGSEATPAAYVAALLDCTREWVRVLKPSGSMFVNLGDKYGGGTWPSRHGKGATTLREFGPKTGQAPTSATQALSAPKSLLGLPWRYALGCIDDLGLILRAEIIWEKVNGLPESVQDRVRRSHEQIFHFVKQPRYYSAIDEIREPHAPDTWRPSKVGAAAMGGRNVSLPRTATGEYAGPNPLGRLPGSVWHPAEEPGILRSVLSAIHTGSLSVDEGERILSGAAWTGSPATGPMWISPATAGSGQAASQARDTASSGSTAGPSAHTASVTPSPVGHSPIPASTLTSISSSANALVNMPVTNSVIGMVRFPLGPWATTSAPVVNSTEFQSPSGSQWAIEPQKVPRLRTNGSATQGAAEASTPNIWSEAATSAWRTSAPIRRCPLARSIVSRSGSALPGGSIFAWHTAQTLSDSFWFPELVETFPSHHIDPAWLWSGVVILAHVGLTVRRIAKTLSDLEMIRSGDVRA
jgi:hypothetical protein